MTNAQDVSNIHIKKASCTSGTADSLTTRACNMPRTPKSPNLNDVGAHSDLNVSPDLRAGYMPQTIACCPHAIDLYRVRNLAWVSQCSGYGIHRRLGYICMHGPLPCSSPGPKCAQ